MIEYIYVLYAKYPSGIELPIKFSLDEDLLHHYMSKFNYTAFPFDFRIIKVKLLTNQDFIL